ncbi:D-alanyl-D-alanine carboxypeptidase/D-alanyl-D-alanine-endopeptidase [Gulosibacter massiliensis]|uniref:D-alanyl-D-alanine carboxypeptidase/D-alanyl-D-alanine-endopeptidase n=1 Tax=Gulosibacter massiliensis TaxID=2479839 RepID=UPI000F631CF6|nr:D-alanyl-D-alanine carboxypeptidase [Gulosibacter massiliensis]
MNTQQADAPGRRRAPWLVTLLAIALVGGLALGAGAARMGLLPESAAPTPTPTEVVVPHPTVTTGSSTPRTCSIADDVTSSAALDFHGIVERADTGEVLFARQEDEATPTASVMKLVTAVTAVSTLGADTRLPTTVYPGTEAGSVVLVGGGDPTLKSQTTSYYAQATASVAELADAVTAAGGATTVSYDDSLFTGDTWQPSWNDADRVDGSTSAISALMIDAGRADPTTEYSPRTLTPSEDAADAFAAALGADVDDTIGIEPDSEPIAEVWSPTVEQLVETMLLDSDNVIAEVLARLVAIELGAGSDFDAVDAGQQLALDALDVSTAGFVGADGSGLSRDNRGSAATIVGLLELIDAGDDGLGILRDYLPENMQSGTLEQRINGVPDGAVQAKTGYTDQVYALAGFMVLPEGVQLTFALFVAVPNPETDATTTTITNRNALDAAATAIYNCGIELTNR